jgi:hypothetical protein
MTEKTAPVPFPDGPSPRMVTDVEDEVLARAARARYRSDGIVGIDADDGIRSVLDDGEQLLAVPQSATVEWLSDDGRSLARGRLAVTTRRLLIISDAAAVALASLDELDEVTLVSDRLLVMLNGGAGFTIIAPRPMLLRVELAAARASRLEA